MSLDEWIATQYGPDKHFKSARQLSLAVSDGKNPNVVYDIEQRGNARFDTLKRLAETLNLPLALILLCAGWLTECDLMLPEASRLNEEERELLSLYRRTRPDLRRVAVAGLRAASQFPPEQSEG